MDLIGSLILNMIIDFAPECQATAKLKLAKDEMEGKREGDNFYSSLLISLEAATGGRNCTFQ